MFSTNLGGIPGPTPGELWLSAASAYSIRGTVAMSGDGTRAAFSTGVSINVSTDDGINWVSRSPAVTPPTMYYQGVAMSDNGLKITACGFNNDGGYLYTSADGGSTWTQRGTNRQWSAVCVSADGTKQVAESGGAAPHLHTSTDSGATWTPRTVAASFYGTSLACSAAGDRVLAGCYFSPGGMYRSLDYGVTWAQVVASSNVYGIAMSADGMVCLASVQGQPLQLSTDGGTTWADTESTRAWSGVAVSADGTKLIAQVLNGQTYISTDGGTVWLARGPSANWLALACSDDGQKLISNGTGARVSIGEY